MDIQANMDSNKKLKIEIVFINLTVLLFLFRTSIPFFKYPFILLSVFYIAFMLFSKSNWNLISFVSIYKFLKNNIIVFILFIIFILAYLFFTPKNYLILLKDIVNIIVLLVLFYLTGLKVIDNNALTDFLSIFSRLIVVFATAIAISNISNQLELPIKNLLFNSDYSNYLKVSDYGEKLSIDYNFSLLPVFYGFIIVIFSFKKPKTPFQTIIYLIFLILCSIQILLSGSKRGFILFLMIHLILIVIAVFCILNKRSHSKHFIKNLVNYLASFSGLILFIVLIFSFTSIYTKNNILRCIGSENIYFVKDNLTSRLYRYVKIIDKKITFDDVYTKIWQPVFDSNEPDCGWGKGVYKTIVKLEGENVEIVPKNSKGCLIDKRCSASSDEAHSYYSPLIITLNLNNNDTLMASIYCYVTKDFNGDVVAFETERQDCGRITGYYDLQNKGVWQKLQFITSCSGSLPIYLYMNKLDSNKFSNLNGFVIFAHPEFQYSSGNNALQSLTKDQFIYPKNRCYFAGVADTSYPDNIYEAGFLNFSNIVADGIMSSSINGFDNFLSKHYKTDTTYISFHSDLETDYKVDEYEADRISRWKFAFEIYTKEYNWKKKVFGGGFSFLNWYGYVFEKDKTATDYPHNPFLYILLYSGIIGVLLYIVLLYQAVRLYWRYRKEYPLLFIFFLVTYYFTFFSGGNPFDPPMMGFFMMLPFFIHSVNQSDQISTLLE